MKVDNGDFFPKGSPKNIYHSKKNMSNVVIQYSKQVKNSNPGPIKIRVKSFILRDEVKF